MIRHRDKLTGLYEQEYFEARLGEEVRRTIRYKRPLSLLMMEIDFYFYSPKTDIKWAFSYMIFKQFGSLLLRSFRTVDIAGRYEGEFFVVFLPETDEEHSLLAAERFRKIVEEHTFLGDAKVPQIKVAVNIGVSVFSKHGKLPQELLSSAHRAMLEARSAGGNRVVLFPYEIHSHEDVKSSVTSKQTRSSS